MKMKKMTALLLTAAMTMSLFACKPAETDETDTPSGTPVQAETVKLENAYIETKIDLDFGDNNYITYACANDRIYYTKTDYIKNAEGENTGQTQKIMSCDENGGDVIQLWEKSTEVSDPEAIIQNYEYMQTFAVDSSGNLWIAMQKTEYDMSDANYPIYKSTFELQKLGPDGTVLAVCDLSEALGENGYIQNMNFDKNGNVYIQSYDSIAVVTGDTAEHLFSVQEPNYIQGIAATNEGNIVYVTYSGEGYVVVPIDFEAKSASAPLKYEGAHYFNYLFNGSGDYGFYYPYNDYIYGMRLDTMTSEIVVNFLNSDINGMYMQRLSPMSDGSFIISKNAWGDADQDETGLYRLVYNPDASTEGKTLLKLGAVYLDSYTREAVQIFNKSSSTARIQVVDYSLYSTNEDYMAGYTQLDLDILGGKAPDIISMSGLNPTKYISKGALADLTELLDGDPNVNRENLFENILQAGSQNGKLYHIIAFYSVISLIGKTSLFGEASEVSMAKINAVAEQYPEAELIPDFTATQWLSICVILGLDGFIDWANGTCDFTGEEFIALLESAKHLPADLSGSAYARREDYQAYIDDYQKKFKEDRALLQYTQVSQVRAARDAEKLYGEEVSFIGFPSAVGASGAIISPSSDFAISNSSKSKEEAWKFISMFITGEVKFDTTWGTSIQRSIFEEKAALELTPMSERDYSKGVMITETYGNGSSSWMVNSYAELGEGYENYHLTEEEVAKVRQVLESAKRVYSGNEKIMEIIIEEAEAFLAGAKTAAEAAQIIQSRVSIYVSENS